MSEVLGMGEVGQVVRNIPFKNLKRSRRKITNFSQCCSGIEIRSVPREIIKQAKGKYHQHDKG